MAKIVLDMEWNQPMRSDQTKVLENGSRLVGEIMQIGAVKLSEQGRECSTFKCNIRPKYYRKLHYQVGKLTGMTQKQLDSGMDFEKAMQAFFKWCEKDPVLLTWGYDDIPMLKVNLMAHGMQEFADIHWYNLQIIYNRQTDTGDNQKALSTALEHFEIPMDLPAHDALNDAIYTARVCTKLNLEEGMRDYPVMSIDESCATQIQEVLLEEYRLLRSRVDQYKNSKKKLVCPLCKGAVQATPFVRMGANKYIAMATCAEHGDWFYQLKGQKRGKGWRLALLALPASDKLCQLYREKREIVNAKAAAKQCEVNKNGEEKTV